MIKNSFRIYKGDLKKIFKNYSAVIIIITLSLLPSLYAWFNIKACWDPYSKEATGQIKVGVVNKDRGTVLNNKDVNIGNQVVDELKNNETLGWCFMSEEESSKALENGEIYASITIDENFSHDITSFITKDIKKGEIIYTVNEKINAIAPKITSKGATAVQENVNKTVVESVSRVVLDAAKDAGYKIKEDVLPKLAECENILIEVEGKFGDINSTVNNADTAANKITELLTSVENDMPAIEDTISNTENLTDSIQNFINTSKQGLKDLTPSLKQDLSLVNKISSDMSKYTTDIINAVNSGKADAPQMIASLKEKMNSMRDMLSSVISVLDKLNNMSINKQFQDVLNDLNNLKGGLDSAYNIITSLEQNINNGGGINLSALENIKSLSDKINATTGNILNVFDNEIAGKIDEILDEAFQVAQNVLTTLESAKTKIPQVKDILTSVLDVMDKSSKGLSYLKDNLPSAEEKVKFLKDKLSEINDNSSIKELIDLLLNDVNERSDFLGNPVEIKENDLFPMGNYGSAMTPFYSILCLWVGGTLMTSMLGVKAHGDYSSSEEYLGKLFLFASVGIAQAVIAALGDLYLLNIYCVNPVIFFIGLVFAAMVFTTIIYSLVSVFGNVGKVVAIILMVLQVAGSGGTFPIQLTPRFFQIINPFLPFTYAISMEREAIGGIVRNVILRDILVLLVFMAASIALSLVLKKPFNKRMKKFTEKFEESGIGE